MKIFLKIEMKRIGILKTDKVFEEHRSLLQYCFDLLLQMRIYIKTFSIQNKVTAKKETVKKTKIQVST